MFSLFSSQGPDKPVSFMTEFNNYHLNIKFTYESNKEKNHVS